MNKLQPYLEKYTGRTSRFACPNCNDPHSFARYLDGDTGLCIHKDVGRCNHESSCGYHYTPKQYFIDNPTKDERSVPSRHKSKPIEAKPIEIGTIPFSYIERSVSYKSTFIYFLCKLFDRARLESPTIERLMNDYALGATKDGGIIYWQIDIKGRVRTGKVMQYNRETGKRVKDTGGVNWIHALMKKQKQLSDSYNLVQCLFGEHLLKVYPDKKVALVESEKSAIIASGVFPDYIWLATGGKSQLSIDKLNVLKGRTVIMFPDVDGYQYWQDKAKEMSFCKVVVSDILEQNATEKERAAKIDIADWLINGLMNDNLPTMRQQMTDSERILLNMVSINPLVEVLINEFNLQIIE